MAKGVARQHRRGTIELRARIAPADPRDMPVEQLKSWVKTTFGPDAYERVVWLYYATIGEVLGEPRLRFSLIASTVLVALAFYWLTIGKDRSFKGFGRFLLPRQVFLHRSALLDYRFFVVNQMVMGHLQLGRWVTGLVGLLAVSHLVASSLAALFGSPGLAPQSPSLVALIAFTAVSLLAWDFGKYVAHYLTHKVPLLWEFHKVHHAAEVLTPVSAFRAHPIDIMIDFFFRLLCTGVVGGVYAYMYPSGIAELTILGFNAVAFVIYYWIAHLQHSHIPLGYGRLSCLLVSPVMHQVHHSCEVHHWDRNFGFLFGIWDWMFGTIHVPKKGEPFRLGLPGGAAGYQTVSELYVTPFVGVARKLRARRSTTSSA
jgi:sterol desaturase/sphingolipid hydroxylase (fatty acid hydroxylase superfamily)